MFSSKIRFTAVRVSCTDSLGGPVKASNSSWLSIPARGRFREMNIRSRSVMVSNEERRGQKTRQMISLMSLSINYL